MLVTTERDAVMRFFSLSSFASNTFSSLHQNKNSTLYNKNYLSVLYIKIILFPARSQHMIPLHPVSFLPFFQVVHTQVNLNKIDFPIVCALPCMDLFVSRCLMYSYDVSRLSRETLNLHTREISGLNHLFQS